VTKYLGEIRRITHQITGKANLLGPLSVRPVDEQFKPELLWLGSPLNMNFSIILICIPEFLLKIALQFFVILINLF